MKKLFCLLFLICIFCSGCKNKSPGVTPITSELSFDTEIEYLGETEKYSVVFETDSVSVFCQSTGVNTVFKDDTATFSFDSISHETKIENLPKELIIDLFYEMKTGIEKTSDIKLKNNEYYIDFKTDKYNFSICFSQTGLPLKITEKNNGIYFEITNTKILQK